jgi:hypothetical protein
VFLEDKRPQREADNLVQYNKEGKNFYSFTFIPPYTLLCRGRHMINILSVLYVRVQITEGHKAHITEHRRSSTLRHPLNLIIFSSESSVL